MPPASLDAAAAVPDALPASPRADLTDALVWLLLGGAVVAGSVVMDRLGDQDVPPFAAPGLLPGLLGIGLLLLGSVLLGRSLRGGALGARPPGQAPSRPSGRAALAIGLCVLFGTVLVGHGLPFWLAAALFVTVAIVLLRRRPADARGVLAASVIGLCAGGAITLVFQQIFLVRLP